MTPAFRDIAADGLWRNNAGLVQLLGLCPLLAVTTTLVNGLGLGLATTFVLVGSNTVVSLLRPLLREEIRIAVFVVVIASLVTTVELMVKAYFYEFFRALGIFLPLIVTNCAIIGRAEAFASRQPILPSIVDGFATGAGFTAVLVALGGARELLGQGTLFAQARMLLGDAGDALTLNLTGGNGLLLALLPPGAFIGLGLLVAGKKALDLRASRPVAPAGVPVGAGA